MSSSSAPDAVPITQLGLTAEDVNLIRQGQAAVAAGGGSSSSRAASRASSHGMLMMDSSSLQQLAVYFERVMYQIGQQIQTLEMQCDAATQAMVDQSGQLIQDCQAEIDRFNRLNQDLDNLEVEFDKISSIKDIVKGWKERAEMLERELEMSAPSSRHHHSSSSSRHGHGHSSSSRHGHGHSSSSSHKHGHSSSSKHRHH